MSPIRFLSKVQPYGKPCPPGVSRLVVASLPKRGALSCWLFRLSLLLPLSTGACAEGVGDAAVLPQNLAAGGQTSQGGEPSGGQSAGGESSGGMPAVAGGGMTSAGGAIEVVGLGGSPPSAAGSDSGGSPPIEQPDAGGEEPQDDCPDDPDKTEPGQCGCGVPDEDSAGLASCVGIRDALIHRYTFDGTGTTAMDSVGTAHGTVINTTLPGTGVLPLMGGNDDANEQYVELPAGIISSLTNATFEAWVNWTDGLSQWQRVFDFGSTANNNGDSYLFLAPSTFRTAYRLSAADPEVILDAPAPFPTVSTTHVAVVVDDTANTLGLYLNGVYQGMVVLNESLSQINDTGNWLGRSHYVADPAFGGNLREFRIYDAALSGAQIATSALAGEDPEFLAEP